MWQNLLRGGGHNWSVWGAKFLFRASRIKFLFLFLDFLFIFPEFFVPRNLAPPLAEILKPPLRGDHVYEEKPYIICHSHLRTEQLVYTYIYAI